MNNIEKYKQYEEIIDEIGRNFCESFFPGGLPDKIYRIGTNFQKYEYGLFVEEAKIESISYHFKNEFRKPYFHKRPSKEQVEQIKALSERLSIDDLEKSNVCLHVKSGNSGWGVKLNELDEKKSSFDRNDMTVILAERIEFYKANYLVGENQFACAYCRKATDNDKKVTRDIISRQYSNFRKSFDYCSTECASHDQMAHEG